MSLNQEKFAQSLGIAAPSGPDDPAGDTSALEDIGDVSARRQHIFDQVRQATASLGDIEGPQHVLKLADVHYDGPEQYGRRDEKAAILQNGTLSRRLRGTWQLYDKQGQLLSERTTTLARVPYLIDQGTFIFRGNKYGMVRQPRLLPGVYVRRKENGDLEGQVNTSKFTHRYFVDPESERMQIEFGKARIPLLPLLRTMGATEKDIRAAWGDRIFQANLQKDDNVAIHKLAAKVFRDKPPTDKPITVALKEKFESFRLDPFVTQRTLGKPYEQLNSEVILATTKKLLALHRGEVESDDRDALEYQQLVNPETIFAEQIGRSKPSLYRYAQRVFRDGTLDRMPAAVLNEAMDAALLNTGLASALQEINPAEVLDHNYRMTKLGAGGISSIDQIPDESRDVQISYSNFIDPILTPESERIGVDSRVSINTKVGRDGRLYARYLDPRTRQEVWRSPQDLVGKTIAFPGELKPGVKHVRAIVGGKLDYADVGKVDLVAADMSDSFSPLTNLVPLKMAAFPQRVGMGARMLTQAVPLINREAPYVQSGMSDQDKSFEDLFGSRMGAVRSPVGGHVVSVSDDEIVVKNDQGKKQTIELLNNVPHNQKTPWHNTALVTAGQRIEPGQLLAKSNYTDDNGTTALGLNARVAFTSYRGENYEDAIVISESFAERTRSEHMYQHSLDSETGMHVDRSKFISLFPAKYDRKKIENFGDDGVIKPGTQVEYGDPLILATKERPYGSIFVRRRAWDDVSVTWNHHSPGVVTDVFRQKSGVNVIVKSTNKTEVGDKLSNRFGGKGVISRIIPDEQMPHDSQGQPFEVLLNEQGVQSRGNPVVNIEAAIGKVAAKLGKPFKLPDFQEIDSLAEFSERLLRQHGLSATEDITDPVTGRKIKNVNTGNAFILKLHHTAEAKLGGRATGGYTQDESPSKGGETGAKRVGMLDLSAMLSHGAFSAIRDASVVRGQSNPELWRQVMSGYSPTQARVPKVYQKFFDYLKASGINTQRQGENIRFMATTDSDIDRLAGSREIRSSRTVQQQGEKLTPIKGGLFDEALTGGLGGNRWSYIRLHEPLPNPIMEEPIRRVLDLSEKQYREIISGQQEFHGQTGAKAIVETLSQLNLDKELERARQEAKDTRKGVRDKAIRRLGYLKSAQELDIHPKQWILSKFPVLPPTMRPVSLMQHNQRPLVSDANFLYQDLLNANNSWRDLAGQVDNVGEERLQTYDAMQAVVGLVDPVSKKSQDQQVRGLLKQVIGSSPKTGWLQRKLLGSTVDLVGRGTIIPNPRLSMDQIGIPVEQAWTVYEPFIVRRLVRRGTDKLRAAELVTKRDPVALQALQEEMQVRPVIVNRAPVLHKFGIMAAWPVLSQHKVIEVPPAVTSGYGADFDGNCVTFNTKVQLRLDRSNIRNSEIGETWLRELEATVETLSWSVDDIALVQLPIGKFPRVGMFVYDRTGAEVYSVPDGVQIISYDHATGIVAWFSIQHVTVDRRHACSLVTTDNDQELEVSNNESLAVFDVENGGLRRIRPDVAIGQYVPRVSSSSVVGLLFDKDLATDLSAKDDDIVPITASLSAELQLFLHSNDQQQLCAAIQSISDVATIQRILAKRILTVLPADFSSPHFAEFVRMVENTSVSWERVKSVDVLPDQDVFDLEVPATRVFMVQNGLIVWDTMQFHVPASDSAVRNATEKMMPSQNLIAPATMQVQPTPSQEYHGGLWLATARKKKTRSPRVFATKQDVIAAFRRGELNSDDEIIVHEQTN